MDKAEADKRSKQNAISGYQHHAYEREKYELHAILNMKTLDTLHEVSLATYADVLAPDPFRAMQNGAICLTTLLSRTAIDSGVPAELGFTVSDYYVYEVEMQKTQAQLEALAYQMAEHFRALVRQHREQNFSQPVSRAIRYVHDHLYEPCRVQDIAVHIGCNPNYLSTLFKQEVGLPPSQYILRKKIEEAKVLFSQYSYTIAEIAEMLGFCNPGHFSSGFRRLEGLSPREYLQGLQEGL